MCSQQQTHHKCWITIDFYLALVHWQIPSAWGAPSSHFFFVFHETQKGARKPSQDRALSCINNSKRSRAPVVNTTGDHLQRLVATNLADPRITMLWLIKVDAALTTSHHMTSHFQLLVLSSSSANMQNQRNNTRYHNNQNMTVQVAWQEGNFSTTHSVTKINANE